MDSAISADHRIKLKERERMDKCLDLPRELRKLWNMKVTLTPITIDDFSIATKGLLKWLKDLKNKKTRGDYPNYYITENGQNTEKSPGELRKHAVS